MQTMESLIWVTRSWSKGELMGGGFFQCIFSRINAGFIWSCVITKLSYYKCVLHNWSDEDCVRILKRSKEAISASGPKGKVVNIDTVAGSVASKRALKAQLLMDVCMMMLTTGEERDEKWHGLFVDAGFSRYKINPILGSQSLIEVFP
jgi:hypothetical protein